AMVARADGLDIRRDADLAAGYYLSVLLGHGVIKVGARRCPVRRGTYLSVFRYATSARRSWAEMIPPQWGMLTIGARPITLPLRMKSMIFASVLNWWRKSIPERGGIVLSGDCGLGTPPRPFGPWQLMQP